MADAPYVLVVTTIDDEAAARRMASLLVERKLAACVQVSGPLTSVYRWQGREESAREFQVSAKTREDLYKDMERTICEIHSYEVPEILAVPIAAGSRTYLSWLEQQLIPPTP